MGRMEPMSDDDTPRRPRVARAARVVARAAAAVGLLAVLLLAALHLPPVGRAVTRAAVARASAALGCDVEAGDVRWNLLAGRVELRDVALRGTGERAGTEIALRRGRVDLSVAALVRRRIVLEEVLLEEPSVRLALEADGRVLLPFPLPDDEEPPEPGRPDVEVRAFRLSGGRVEVVDRGPAGRRVDAREIVLEGSLSLPELASRGSLALGAVDVAATGLDPLRGSSLAASWEARDGRATVAARLDAREAGLGATLDAEFRDLASTPRYTATLSTGGTLGPLAARLAPHLGLGGAIDARVVASGAGGEPVSANATAGAAGLTLLGRTFERVDLAAEVDGGLLKTATLDVVAGGGRLRADASGTVHPEPKDLRFSVRADGLDLGDLLHRPPGAPRIAATLRGSIEGTLARPGLEGLAATADLSVAGSRPRRRGALAPDGRARLRLAGGVLTADSVELSERETKAALSGLYDHPAGRFEGRLDVASGDVGPWLALFGVEGGGRLTVRLSGGGPLARPALDGRLRAEGLVAGGARIDVVELDAKASGPRLTVSGGSIAAHDVTAEFDADGRLPLPGVREPELDLRVRGIRLRGRPLPDVAAHASLGGTLGARLETSDGRLTARALAPARGGFEAEAALARFDLSPFAGFLPAHLADLRGEVSGRLEASRGRTGPLSATLLLGDSFVAVAGRRLSTSGAAARLRGDEVEVEEVEIRGDEGSLLALSGTGRLDGSAVAGQVRLEVPQLAAFQALLPPEPREEAGAASPNNGTDPRAALAGSVSGELRISGSLERPEVAGEVRLRGVRALGAALARLDVALAPEEEGRIRAAVTLEDLSRETWRLPSARLDAVLSGSEVRAEGRAFDGRLYLAATGSLAGARPFEATATLDALDLAPFVRAAGGPDGTSAKATGSVRLRGAASDPASLTAEAELTALEASHEAGDLRAAEPVRLSWDGSGLHVRSLRLAGRRTSLEARGGLPLEGRDGRLGVSATLDLAVLLPFVDALDRAEGRLSARLEIGGSLAEPSATGEVTLEEALLDGPAFPTPLEKLSGTFTARRDEIRTDAFSARIGGGSVVVAGAVGLADGKPSRVNATLRARDLELEYGADVQVRAGADLAAKGAWSEVAVTGEVRLEDVVWVPAFDLTGLLGSLASRRRPPAEEPPAARSALVPRVVLDVAVVARDAIHVEGAVGDAELGGTLRVTGSPEKPVVLGTVSSTRGTINLFGSVFELSRARVELSDPHAIDPDLDVVATTTKGDEEITVRVEGRASRAQLLLSSSRGRSQAEIVSLLLGGSGDAGGSALAAAAARMALRGATSPLLGALGGHADLEIVPLPTTPEGEEFLFSVGKDLGGGFSATYFKGVSGETTDAIEMKWRISSRARGRLRQNQDGSLSGGFRIRRDLD